MKRQTRCGARRDRPIGRLRAAIDVERNGIDAAQNRQRETQHFAGVAPFRHVQRAFFARAAVSGPAAVRRTVDDDRQ
ncbi:hypothetical protein QZM52_27305 [Burkholderia metallica]|uniref:Uncharacterized protein n=1 Tax=Burkholderia metallica TaxID=488729 RepID=A0ABT8PJE7_9BURK|nr:hypothetical protein [Burkholderia metallica]MDN7934986.1 hypothetical protein [Burkholderia metallica]